MNTEEQITQYVHNLDERELSALRDFVELPNRPDIQPEIIALHMKHGKALGVCC